VPDQLLFDRLHGHRGERDEPAQRYAPTQRNRSRDHAAGGIDTVSGFNPIWHAKSFKEKKLCARSSGMENIISV
jgi:hypothetical protein